MIGSVTAADHDQAWAPLASDLRRYVRARVADPHAAEDLVQDVFVKLAQQVHDRPPAGPLAAWVFRTARNAVIDHWRRGRPGEPLPDDLVDTAATPAATANADAAPLLASFRAFVHALPAEQREAILRTEYEGVSQHELARQLGVPVSTVKSRVQRGRERLAKALHDCCTFEFDRRGGLVDWQRRPGGSGCGDCDCP
jgi:RNA polymerase sigma-70 factor (ECF subfamily)